MTNLPAVSRWKVIRNRKRILKNPLPFHRENFEKLGDSFKVSVGPPGGVIFTRDPQVARHILQKNHRNFEKSELQTVDLAKYIGHGLLTSNGEHWRVHRRMIQPGFHKSKLESLLGTMNAAIEEELELIASGEAQDVYPLMSDLAFQVVAKSLFSRSDIRAKMNELQEITESCQRMLIREMRQPYLNWWFRWSGLIDKYLKRADEGRAILNSIVEERVRSGSEHHDLLDMLLHAQYEDVTHMPRRQLIDEVMILFTAGHETTANALSFALYLLSKSPEVQDKIYEEVCGISFSEPLTLDLFKGLSYTKHTIEEAMRIFPPVYVIDRVVIEDDQIGDLRLKKGSLVLMSVYELHRNAQFWKDPQKFNPERFAEKSPKELSNYYYPFGAGPRMCIGNNFAMYEMILTIAKIIQGFNLTSSLDRVELNPLISLKPVSVPITFHRR